MIGVAAGLRDRPEVEALRRRYGWLEVTLPADDPAPSLRDACDLVIDRLPVTPGLEARILAARDGGPRTEGPEIVRWLMERAAGAAVRPERVRAVLPALALATALLLGLVAFARRRGWGAVRTTAAAAGLAALLLVARAATTADRGRPRASARGAAVLRSDGGRIDLLVVSGRGRVTLDLAAPEGSLLRPLPGPTGRTGPYVLRDARVLEGVEVGAGRHALVRIDRDGTPGAGEPADLGGLALEDAFVSRGEDAVWLGAWTLGPPPPDGPAEGWEAIRDRFREGRTTRPLGARGSLLWRIARPALVPGIYGFLAEPPALDAEALGVETARIEEALLVP